MTDHAKELASKIDDRFALVGIIRLGYVGPRHFRPSEVECLLGDASKVDDELGWQPMTDCAGLAEMMVDTDLASR